MKQRETRGILGSWGKLISFFPGQKILNLISSYFLEVSLHPLCYSFFHQLSWLAGGLPVFLLGQAAEAA